MMRRFLAYSAVLLAGVGAGGGAIYTANQFHLFDSSSPSPGGGGGGAVTAAEKEAARKGVLDNLQGLTRTGGDPYLGANVVEVRLDEGGQLALIGQVDSNEQAALLQKAAEDALAKNP